MPRILLFPALLLASLTTAPAAEGATVIVKYRPGTSSVRRQAAARRAGVGRVVGTVRGQGARVVEVRGDPAAAARSLNRSPGVLYAEPNRRMHILTAPNDPLYGQMDSLTAIHASTGWTALGLGRFPAGGGVRVAVIDAGVDATHEDLAGKLVACGTAVNGAVVSGQCADENDHGTHVSGTIAAVANNSRGIAGVAFNSSLIECRAMGADGSGDTADVAGCVSWAHARGAKVISMSLGGPVSTTLRNAVRDAWAGGGRRGAVLVAAAGNDGDSGIDYPAGYDEVVSVAAVDSAGRHAAFSNANDDVELAAPGVDVLSTRRGGGYVRFSGTSMATPHVAGAAALVWGEHRRSAAQTIRARLDAAVADLGVAGRDPVFGFGLIDLERVGAG